jgi:hypothetical protein
VFRAKLLNDALNNLGGNKKGLNQRAYVLKNYGITPSATYFFITKKVSPPSLKLRRVNKKVYNVIL